MTVEIRNADVADRDRCLELLGLLGSATGGQAHADAGVAFAQLINRARGQVHVAARDDEVLGLAAVSYNLAMRYGGEYCQLEELIVDPQARGMNVGGLLIEAVLAAARARGCAECGLYLLPTTVHNRPFYEKYGFVALDVEMRQAL